MNKEPKFGGDLIGSAREPMLDAALYKIMELEQQLATLRELREIDSKKLAAKVAENERLRTAFNVWSNSDECQKNDVLLCLDFKEK